MAGKGGFLERLSRRAIEWTGSSPAFGLAVGIIAVWAITGPLFSFSDTWQLVINTGTTIVTFLMVFLIQRAQNKDSAAIHLKLNELVAALPGSSNRLINAEELSEDEVKTLRRHFLKLVELAQRDENFNCAHSIEEAEIEHEEKVSRAAKRRKRRRRGHRRAPQCEQGPSKAPEQPQTTPNGPSRSPKPV